jgi:hypothetical protein
MKRMLLIAALSGSVLWPAYGGPSSIVIDDNDEAELAYEDLIDDYDAERMAYMEKARGAKGQEIAELQKIRSEKEAEFVLRFIGAAEEYAATDGAVPFLSWLVFNAPSDGEESTARIALETLYDVHIDSKAMASFASQLGQLSYILDDEKLAIGYTDRLVAGNRHPEVQASALFAQAVMMKGRGDPAAAKHATILASFKKAKKLGEGMEVAKSAEHYIFELENLQIGMKAPDIAGNDLDGAAFKLSDYNGKVVVIDFWGDW